MSDGGREQDQGRSHKRKGDPSPESRRRVERWRDVMRAELDMIADALEAKAKGLVGEDLVIPLDDPKRDRLVSRGIQVAKELGAEIDPASATPADAPAGRPPKRRGRVDFGGE